MARPKDIQSIGNEIAIAWDDGSESFISFERLRAASPSAETQGERDILGHLHGGDSRTDFSGVTVDSWSLIGNYAIRFVFSDGHRTGLYSYELLRALGQNS